MVHGVSGYRFYITVTTLIPRLTGDQANEQEERASESCRCLGTTRV